MGRRQGASEERRTAILDAAEAVFTEQGYEGAAIREIARRAEVSSALLYWFFPQGKTQLFAKVLVRRADTQEVLTFPPALMEAPPEEVVPLLGQGFIGLLTMPDQIGLMRLMLHDIDRHPEMVSALREAILDRALRPLEAYFARQQALGRIRQMPLAYVTQAFISLFLGLVMRRELLQEPESRAWPPHEYMATAVELFLHGLLPRPGEIIEPAPIVDITPAPPPSPATPAPRHATRIALDTDEE